MFEVAIITASDKGAKGLREDLSGPCIKQIVEESDYKVVSMEILPDNRALLADKMIELADKEIPGVSFSITSFVASGVLSLGEKPVPPVVKIKGISLSASSIILSANKALLSGKISIDTTL